MHAVFHRGLVLTGLAVAVGLAASSAGVAARPGSVPPAGNAPADSSSLAAVPCNPLWDLLNSTGRNGPLAIGLTADQQLIKFAVNRPQWACAIGVVDLPGIEDLVGIDYRVQDGNLYGVSGAGGVYTLSTRTAVATKVSQLTIALAGTSFGVDFNPAADRLRIVSNTGQNLRHNVNVGGVTLADSVLTYPPSVVAAAGVSGAAYTNNDLSPTTATSLFDVDTSLDQVALQVPANSGQLSATGALGVAADPRAGFDIYSALRAGRAVSNSAHAVFNGSGVSRAYRVDLLTGEAQPTGAFDAAYLVTDLALRLDQP
ncbi:DUF4394 domain-containing protein [Micromonospora vulcania]|uniref:DUF4394 domain-containing protein n=1 Tax=Micromonospora vulcania TaxID=1441873 RepID=A0ABW1H2Z8_9ACTN